MANPTTIYMRLTPARVAPGFSGHALFACTGRALNLCALAQVKLRFGLAHGCIVSISRGSSPPAGGDD